MKEQRRRKKKTFWYEFRNNKSNNLLSGLPFKVSLRSSLTRCVCCPRFQYSGGTLNTGKNCFQSRVKKCTLSCSHTDRCVWQTWFSEVLPCVPARRIHLYWKLSPFLLFHANAAAFIHFFPFFFLLLYPLSVFVSFFSGAQCDKMNLASLCLSVLLFSFISLYYRFPLPLSSSATPLYIMMPPPSALLPPLPTPPPHNSSLFLLISSPLPPLTVVLERGNEKCMYSLAAQWGSSRENCGFMVLFMDLYISDAMHITHRRRRRNEEQPDVNCCE